MAGTPCPARATNAVHIVFTAKGHIKIEDMGDVGDVEAAGGHVTCHKELNVPLTELIEYLQSHPLVEVAMERGNIETMFGQGTEDHRHIPLPVAKDDRVLDLTAADELAQGLALVFRAHRAHGLGHRLGG